MRLPIKLRTPVAYQLTALVESKIRSQCGSWGWQLSGVASITRDELRIFIEALCESLYEMSESIELEVDPEFLATQDLEVLERLLLLIGAEIGRKQRE